MLIPITSVDRLVLTGYEATIIAATAIAVGVDALVITEYDADVVFDSTSVEVTVGVDALVITTFNPAVIVPLFIYPGYDILRLTEYSAEVTHFLPDLAKELYATSHMKKELKAVSEMEY